MSLRFTTRGLVTVSLLCVIGAPNAEAERRPSGARLTVPITGSIVSGGSFTGTLSLQRFAIREGRIVAVGAISGVATTPGATRSGLQATVELPVTVSEAAAVGAAQIEKQRYSEQSSSDARILLVQTCGVLNINIGGNTIDLLGLIVALDPVVLDVSGDSAGVLGNLVCQILALLNNVVGLVGLLNTLLGALGGLTGGLAV
jgi:hypothetical protein